MAEADEKREKTELAEKETHILNKLWREGRRQVCGYKLDCPDYTREVKKAFGADIFDRINNLKDTWDTLALAKDMLKTYEEPEPEKAPEPIKPPKLEKNDSDDNGDDNSDSDSGEPADSDGESAEGDEGKDDQVAQGPLLCLGLNLQECLPGWWIGRLGVPGTRAVTLARGRP